MKTFSQDRRSSGQDLKPGPLDCEENVGIIFLIRPQVLMSIFFRIHYPCVFLLFYTINSDIPTALLNKKVWEEAIAYFPFIRHGPHRKLSRCLATIRELLPSRCLATIGGGNTDTHTDSNVIS
jgi:hypothetical protein